MFGKKLLCIVALLFSSINAYGNTEVLDIKILPTEYKDFKQR